MSKKKVSFESDVLKQEFAASKPTNAKKYYIFLCAAIAVAVCVAIGYIIYINQTSLSVDWHGYGQALATLKDTYSDYDKVIITVGDDVKITKEEYYKLKILNDFTFNGLMKDYNEYIEKNKDSMTDDEIKALKPSKPTDEDIIESIINIEIGYLAAMDAGVHMDYATSYSQVNANYLSYKNILEVYESDTEIYQKAQDSLTQMELVASGMGIKIDEYLEYLAHDSLKLFATTMLEEKWQNEFKDSEYDGDVDDYIEAKFSQAKDYYGVVYHGL